MTCFSLLISCLFGGCFALRSVLVWRELRFMPVCTKIDTFRFRVDHLGHLGYQSKLYTYHQPFPDSGWTWKVPVRSKKQEHMWKNTYVNNLKKMNRLFDKVRGAKWPHWRPLSNHTLKITFCSQKYVFLKRIGKFLEIVNTFHPCLSLSLANWKA